MISAAPARDLGSRATMIRSVVFFAIAEASNKAGLIVAALIIAYALGPSEFGQWSFALAIAGIIGLLSDIGLPQSTVKSIGAGGDPRGLVANGVAMKLAASLVAFAALALFSVASGKPDDVALTMLILGAGMLATTFAQYVQSIFRAMALTHIEAMMRIIQQLLMIAAVIFVMLDDGGIVAYAVACSASAFASAVVTCAILWLFVLPAAPRVDLTAWRVIARDAWPFWVATLLWLAYYRIDIVLLSYFSDDTQTGLYNMAYNGFQVLTMPPTVLILALFPSFAHLYAHERPRFFKLRIQARNTVIAVAVAVIAVSALVVSPVIDLLLGAEYAGSALLFRVLAGALLFLYPNYVLMYTLAAANRQKSVTVATAVGAAVNVSINLVMIPLFAALGAAIATFATEAIVFVALTYASWRAFQAVPSATDEPVALEAIAA